jgi:rubredoxin
VIRNKRCFGDFKDDRVCDMCELVRPEAYVGCKELHEVAKKMDTFLASVESQCPHRVLGKIGNESYCNCTLNNKNTGKLGVTCDSALKCYKYSRFKGKLEKVICPTCKQVAVWNPEGRNFVCPECGFESKNFKVLNQD